MSSRDGLLTPHYETHCPGCELPALGLGDTRTKAEAALRSMGWKRRLGLWQCAACASK